MKNFAFHAIPGLVIFVLLAIIALVWGQSESLESAYINVFRHNLESRARLVRLVLEPYLDKDMPGTVAHVKKLAKAANTRITIIGSNGQVLIDSEQKPDESENYLGRPEIDAALQSGIGSYIRYSDTARQELMYVALSARGQDAQTYIVRAGMPMYAIHDILFYARRDIIFLSVSMILLMFALGVYMRKRTKVPIENIAAQSLEAVNSDDGFRFAVKNPPPFIALMIERLNFMLSTMKKQIARLAHEKRKRDVIFSSMSEGVIAVDRNGIIIDINLEASRILDLPTLTEGCSLRTLVRGNELHDFTMQVLAGHRPLVEDITIDAESETPRHFRIRGALMKSGNNETTGVVLVLSDLTRLYRLENFRRDFIADVSHEIKTPLTVISGAIEALENGADQNPEEAARFRSMVIQQSERLNNLVRDILNISSLEHRVRGDISDFVPVNLAAAVNNACEMISPRAAAQNIALTVNMPAEVFVNGDPQLLEQAVFNILDNAVKYSGCTGIETIIRIEERIVILQIVDNGCGIERAHLPRLFERFYRIDKTRSRKLGGTGLGLAIVKHTVQYHRGAVSVESSPGNGCIFTIRLPLANI